jgi:hypothetical protein
LAASPQIGAGLLNVGTEEQDERLRQRGPHDRAATGHEQAARGEREAAEASDMFSDADEAEGHLVAARELETRLTTSGTRRTRSDRELVARDVRPNRRRAMQDAGSCSCPVRDDR